MTLGTIRIAGALIAGASLTLLACAADDDGDGAGESGDPAGQVLAVASLDSLEFDPTVVAATAGEVTTEHENEGAVVHTFVIDEADLRLVNGDASTIALGAGEYDFYCDVPGHLEAGMEGTLTVTG